MNGDKLYEAIAHLQSAQMVIGAIDQGLRDDAIEAIETAAAKVVDLAGEADRAKLIDRFTWGLADCLADEALKATAQLAKGD